MNMPKVSVIVPVFNAEGYLNKCLDSLVNQTLREIQLIIVNDGSTDGSQAIIDKYKARHGDKIIVVNKQNGGLSDARNAGMEHAAGTYIGCVDADDYVDITMYEKMYSAAMDTDADYVECDFFYEYVDKTPVKLITKTGEVYGREDMMVKARCNAWNKIIKRDLIERTGIKYPVGLRYEDVEFFCKIIPHVKKIALAREPLYHYIQRKASITHDQNEKNRDLFIILTNVLSYYQENGLYEAYHERLEYLFIKILLGGSFFRAVRIENGALRKAVLSENWHLLNDKFPAWKKNRLLRRGKGVKNLFFKRINRFTYPLCAALLRIYYGAGGK